MGSDRYDEARIYSLYAFGRSLWWESLSETALISVKTVSNDVAEALH